MFQHTAARRRLRVNDALSCYYSGFNTQPRGGGCIYATFQQFFDGVSTHSRAEAAARENLKCLI